MGLTSWRGARVEKSDVGIAENCCTEDGLRALKNLVEQCLVFASGQRRGTFAGLAHAAR